MIVTIDGPAGAGKSSVARALARRLGFRFLDTGAMYRAVTFMAIRDNIDWNDVSALANIAEVLPLRLVEERVFLNGEDVSREIRTSAVTQQVRHVADQPRVREQLVQLQRQFAEGQDIVTEGRDQGTVVFPDAECKIFLTASREERARRRHAELEEKGESTVVEEILEQQDHRDLQDTQRDVGALVAADDAHVVVTDGMSLEEVIDHLEGVVRRSQQRKSASQPVDPTQ
jgi:cytidylate kinase/pantoate ligase/cytidylate kinase